MKFNNLCNGNLRLDQGVAGQGQRRQDFSNCRWKCISTNSTTALLPSASTNRVECVKIVTKKLTRLFKFLRVLDNSGMVSSTCRYFTQPFFFKCLAQPQLWLYFISMFLEVWIMWVLQPSVPLSYESNRLYIDRELQAFHKPTKGWPWERAISPQRNFNAHGHTSYGEGIVDSAYECAKESNEEEDYGREAFAGGPTDYKAPPTVETLCGGEAYRRRGWSRDGGICEHDKESGTEVSCSFTCDENCYTPLAMFTRRRCHLWFVVKVWLASSDCYINFLEITRPVLMQPWFVLRCKWCRTRRKSARNTSK